MRVPLSATVQSQWSLGMEIKQSFNVTNIQQPLTSSMKYFQAHGILHIENVIGPIANISIVVLTT